MALATWARNLLAAVLGGTVILSGFCSASLILKLFTKSGDMELSSAGFRFLPRDMGSQLWLNCGEFEVGNGLFVAVRYRVYATDKVDNEGQPEHNRWISNHYVLAPKELAATLNAFRNRALQRAVS